MKRSEVRSQLRIADLKQQPRATTRLMNVKVPAKIANEVDRIAEQLDVSKTEVVVALLNTGLDVTGTKLRR